MYLTKNLYPEYRKDSYHTEKIEVIQHENEHGTKEVLQMVNSTHATALNVTSHWKMHITAMTRRHITTSMNGWNF